MEFDWDENKRRDVWKKHRVDMGYAALIFEGPVFYDPDSRQDYGEDRWRAVGKVDDEYFVLIFTPRDGRKRLITAWKAGRDDRREYEEKLALWPAGDAGPG